MFEKVNPSHPDKIADRIAGALVDTAYRTAGNPKTAVEVLIGHGSCHIIAETSVSIPKEEVQKTVYRIAGDMDILYEETRQDTHLAENQKTKIRCGDNGIFKGMPVSAEQRKLSDIAREIYRSYPTDGKYVLSGERLILCQSYCNSDELKRKYSGAEVNPLGDWTGGTNVDTGAVNRKLGSDMADGVTGGGIHGKDLSKADVSVNIYAHLLAQKEQRPVEFCCAIGDETVGGIPYEEIVRTAGEYVKSLGGFEKLAEWGLV